jgi:hypothetical protein
MTFKLKNLGKSIAKYETMLFITGEGGFFLLENQR